MGSLFWFYEGRSRGMAEKKRARRSREEWHRLVKRYEAGGLSPKEFCRREGLNENTFRLWRGRVRSADRGPAPFVEVVPAAAPEPSWSIELELPSGAKLRLRG